MKVKIYVEGGGDSKEQHVRWREGFSKLLAKAGFSGRMPGIIACGGRGKAYDSFKASAASMSESPILLVDSEDPLKSDDQEHKTAFAWDHLKARDGWDRPKGVQDDQAQLMVTCMETWIMADKAALRRVFGSKLHENKLKSTYNIESYSRHEVLQALEDATKDSGPAKSYSKGKRSFQVLAELDPAVLKDNAPRFKRLIETLEKHLLCQKQR